MKKIFDLPVVFKVWLLVFMFVTVSCDKETVPAGQEEESSVSLEELASIFSKLHMSQDHLNEVHTAVTSSLEHGYDEEYRMSDLFSSPGSGVGASEIETKASAASWSRPLREVLTEYLETSYPTKSSEASYHSAEEYIQALIGSDAQIYWPLCSKE